jgi:hypothetical protein
MMLFTSNFDVDSAFGHGIVLGLMNVYAKAPRKVLWKSHDHIYTIFCVIFSAALCSSEQLEATRHLFLKDTSRVILLACSLKSRFVISTIAIDGILPWRSVVEV